jgi:hypothetical protein
MSPSSRIYRVIAKRTALEDRAARAQLRLLQQFRRELLKELAATAISGRRVRLESILSVVDREILRWSQAAVSLATDTTRRAVTITGGMAGDVAAVPVASLYGISPELALGLLDVSRDSMRGLWQGIGSRLKLSIRRVVLGLDDAYAAMQSVAKLIRDPLTFRSTFTAAEALVRDGVNRTFGVATYSRAQQAQRAAAATGGRLMKWWLTAEDDRVRPWHEDAGRRYSKAHAVPFAEPFLVGGEELMFPHDPRASVANTRFCRCVLMSFVTRQA